VLRFAVIFPEFKIPQNICFSDNLKGEELWDVNIFKNVYDNIKEITGIQSYKELDQSL